MALTAKGAATRSRIVESAAELVQLHGVADTGLDDVCASTGTSRSQIFHYFPDGKSQLMVAVAARQAEQTLDDQRPLLDALDSWDAWTDWRDLIIEIYSQRIGSCALSSLTRQLPTTDSAVGAVIADMYAQWQAAMERGLASMRDRGLVSTDADVTQLAMSTLATMQGGVLLMQSTGSVGYLEAALDAALANLRSAAAS
jgi:AcrR family transcriptional regulator